MSFKLILASLIIATNICVLYAMGTPPESIQKKYGHKKLELKKNKETKQKNSSQLKSNQEIITQANLKNEENSQNIFAPTQTQINKKATSLNRNEKIKIKELINQNKFAELKILLEKNKNKLNEDEDTILFNVEIFKSIQEKQKTYEKQFGKSKQINQNQITRYLNEAKKNILLSNNTKAKLFLIQTLYIDKSNFIAREMLKKNLNLGADDYVIENIELKQWRESEINFLSNNFEKAITNLNILSVFDPNNAVIYERLGANYYSLSEMDKAIDAWTIAANIDPQNNIVKEAIETAKKVKIEQKKEYEQYIKKRKKENKKIILPEIQNTLLLSVFFDRAAAIKFLNESKAKNKNAKIYLYEKENGSLEIRMLKTRSQNEKSL